MYQIVLILTLSFFILTPLSAQLGEATVYAGVSQIGDGGLGDFGFDAEPVGIENGFKVGARLSLNGSAFTGHEISYGFERHNLNVGGQQEATANVQQLYYDFVIHFTPQAVPIRPFVLAGAGISSFSPREEGVFAPAAGETKVGLNYGGGVKVKLSPLFGLRFDVRDHVTGKPNFLNLPNITGRLHSIEFSAGLSLLF